VGYDSTWWIRGATKQYGILFIASLFCEYMNVQYGRVPVVYRVTQAEYVIRFFVAVPQEYVNTYSTRRVTTGWGGSNRHERAWRGGLGVRSRQRALFFTRYCHYTYCMVYGIHKEGRRGGRVLRNSFAIGSMQVGGAVTEWVSSARQLWSETNLV